jgi:hypothetical protein
MVARQLVVSAAALAILLPVVFVVQGAAGLAAPVIAAFVCIVAALAGMALTLLFGRRLNSYQRMAVAMSLRMAIPLLFCLWTLTTKTAGPLAGPAIVLYTVLFYLITLAVDVWSRVSGGTAR